MTKLIRYLFFSLLIICMLVVFLYHIAQFKTPEVDSRAINQGSALFIDQSELGIHQLVLEGDSYTRGHHAGIKTKEILKRQEDALYEKLNYWLPSRLLQKTSILAAALWFMGIESYYYPWTLKEMYGVAHSAADEYDFLASKYMRQVGYHGLHEVGQMMVDRGFEDFGCTVLATPHKNSWLLGRNFDFEGGRIFDEEKLMKWVFPTEGGYAYLSVIWAGMVGAVTGVNEHGVYISINAAGSDDFVRLGTPSTLVALKVLQFSKNAVDAIEILKNEKMLITDIFVLLDTKAGKLFRIEKSPLKTAIIEHHDKTAITNHLISADFKDDKTNHFRKLNLTSLHREERGLELLQKIKPQSTDLQLTQQIVDSLRDKNAGGGAPLYLGNRRAIDALIATHAVVLDGHTQTFYVSRGPSLQGEFIGFDLTRSFKEKRPVTTTHIPEDSALTKETYYQIKHEYQLIHQARRSLKKSDCTNADQILSGINVIFNSSEYLTARADVAECMNQLDEARQYRQKALDAGPPYLNQVNLLTDKLKIRAGQQ